MADQNKRKKGKAKPLTANPLFPAVVALWCGAALGVPSLAIGPSALEALVIKSRIDLILPAAAPPLGLTARILFALALAVIGAVTGMIFARRLARFRSEPRERKRNAATSATEPALRSRDKHPDASVRRPISAHEELGETIAPQSAAPGAPGSRRRALAIIEEPAPFVPEQEAPLPGGEPQILDLAGAEIDQAPVLEVGEDDLNAYADSLPDAENRQLAEAAAEVAPVPEQPLDVDRQVFHPVESVHPADVERQVFGQAPVEPLDEASRQIFGASAVNEDCTTEIVRAAGYQTSVFDSPPAAPLFPARGDQLPEPAAEPAPDAAPAEPIAAIDDSEVPAAKAEQPLLPISSLGMTDLALRLQDSMRRRRAARAAGQALPQASAAPAADGDGEVPPAPHAAEPVAQAAAPVDELPAALRPISLDDADVDDEPLPSLLPPRAIFNPARVPDAFYPAAPSEEPAEPPAEHLADNAADDDTDPADDAESAGSYGSLLEIAPQEPRTSFVRIEEPQPLGEAIEPVVIFPGQGPRAPLAVSTLPGREAAPAAEPSTGENGSFRRFDAPSSASAGQAVAANPAAPTVDRDEAERALRAALSSLQRISGAA